MKMVTMAAIDDVIAVATAAVAATMTLDAALSFRREVEMPREGNQTDFRGFVCRK